jgi:protein-disulfide isomerase
LTIHLTYRCIAHILEQDLRTFMRLITLCLIHIAVVSTLVSSGLAQPPSNGDPVNRIESDLNELKQEQHQMMELLRQVDAELLTRRPASQTPRKGIETIDVANAPALGDTAAPMVLIELADYQCQFCRRHFKETAAGLYDKYIVTGRLSYVFMDVPDERLHPVALAAAEATRCAEDQGRYWEMHRALFSLDHLSDYRDILRAAGTVKLEATTFEECLNSEKYGPSIRQRRDALHLAGVTSTPYFLLGRRESSGHVISVQRVIEGALPMSVFDLAISEADAQLRDARR